MGRGDGNAASGEQSTSRGQCRLSSVGAGLELGREFFRQLTRHGGTQLRRFALDLGAWVSLGQCSVTQYPASVTRARLERRRANDSPSRDPGGAAGVVRAGVSSEIITCRYHN